MYRVPKDISIDKIFSQEKCCGIKVLFHFLIVFLQKKLAKEFRNFVSL